MASMAKRDFYRERHQDQQIPGAVVGRLVFDYLLSDGYLINSFYFEDFLYSTDCWLVKVRDKGERRLPSVEPAVASAVFKSTGQRLQFLSLTLA